MSNCLPWRISIQIESRKQNHPKPTDLLLFILVTTTHGKSQKSVRTEVLRMKFLFFGVFFFGGVWGGCFCFGLVWFFYNLWPYLEPNRRWSVLKFQLHTPWKFYLKGPYFSIFQLLLRLLKGLIKIGFCKHSNMHLWNSFSLNIFIFR